VLELAGSISVDHSTVSPIGPYTTQAGSIGTFTILARDKWNNPVPMVGLPPLWASIAGSTNYNLSLSEDPSFPGNYVTLYNITLAGTYRLTVSATGVGAFVISPNVVNIVPGERSGLITSTFLAFVIVLLGKQNQSLN
jgi:hypothetical protein